MAGSSDNEAPITLSSDHLSSDEKLMKSINYKNKNFISTKSGTHSIIISDTELEEGEISDEGELKIKKFKDSKHNDVKEIIVEKDFDKSHSSVELISDINSVKRKLSEDTLEQESKKGKFTEITDITESFPWSELRVLMLGDERVTHLNWSEWPEFPEQELHHVPQSNLETICNLAEKHLFKEFDVVFLLAFHYDFVCLTNSYKGDDNEDRFSLDLKTDVNINELLKTVNKFHTKWERQYPNTYIIWTLPSPPDFLKYNSFALKDKSIFDTRASRRLQDELSKDYYFLAKKFLKEWKVLNKSIPIFPLHKVLFLKKHCYKRSFDGSEYPKFPRGFLQNGLYPTKMMTMYCAYLLVEFLLDYQFYPENKHGLDIKSAEAKLLEIDPDLKTYLHSSERSNGNSSRRRSRHRSHYRSHRSNRKDGSVSPRNASHRSRSRSHSRRRRKSRQRYSKTNSRSRTRSISKNRHRNEHSKSSRPSRTKISSYSKRSHSKSGSESDSSVKSSASKGSESSVNVIGKAATIDAKTVPSKDELSFFKTLRYLREVHEIQCTVYRRKPHTHPMYKDEKEKFLKRLNSKLPLEFKLPKWEVYWKQRMENIFEQTWIVKKEQLTADLNKKVAFKSLQDYPRNDSAMGMLATSTPNSDDRLQFQIENAETINSYLKEMESTKSFSSDLSQTQNADVDLKNCTLADIFKDATSNNKNQESKARSSNDGGNDNYMSPRDTNKEFRGSSSPLDREELGDNSYCSSDSDLDVDGLMENPDFLQGLEEIDRELQNAVPGESKTETAVEDSNISTSASTSFVPNSDVTFLYNSAKGETGLSDEDLKVEFVNVLKMLFRVSKRLGPLGLSVSALYHRAAEDMKNKEETFASLNSDSKAVLILVDKKLGQLLKENLPQVQKAIFGEIAERLQVLLKKINVEEHDKFSKVNVHSIATATVGQQLSEVVSFIKNTLLYHGYSQFTTDDVMNIYMSVKATQLDMEKS